VKSNGRILGGKIIGEDTEAVLCVTSRTIHSYRCDSFRSNTVTLKFGASYFEVNMCLRPKPVLGRASACAEERPYGNFKESTTGNRVKGSVIYPGNSSQRQTASFKKP
jgi:hypothetical protein